MLQQWGWVTSSHNISYHPFPKNNMSAHVLLLNVLHELGEKLKNDFLFYLFSLVRLVKE